MKQPSDRSALDRPSARIAALGCALLAVGALALIHWDDLFPSAAVAESDPAQAAFQDCFDTRVADIDAQVAAGRFTTEQAALFKRRAEGMCRDIAAGASPAPPAR